MRAAQGRSSPASIWFDDGRIGGVIRRAGRRALEVEITHARGAGQKLAGEHLV